MKKTALLLAIVLLLACACAAAEGGARTPHELAMQKCIAEAPVWAGGGTRMNLHRDERVPVLAAPFFPTTEVDPGPYRGGNGRAEVSLNEPLTVLAVSPYSSGEWLLISYEIRAGENRIGWIEAPESLAPGCAEAACRGDTVLWAGQDTTVTDDPFGSRRAIARIARDEEVRCIGWVGGYAYVQRVIDGRYAFGFVPLSDLVDPNTVRMEGMKDGLVGVWRFSGGAELLGAGVVFDENGRYMLCTADGAEAFPPENLRLCVERSGEYEIVKNDRPVGGEFWDEDAPFAIVLRDFEHGVNRLVCNPESEKEGERMLLTAGEGGDFYSRMRGAEADKLLADLTGMWIVPLANFSDGRVNGKAGVVDHRDLRAYIELDAKEFEAHEIERILLFDRDPWDNGAVFGEATPVEGEWGTFVYEGRLPEGCTCVEFLRIEADGSESRLFDIAW